MVSHRDARDGGAGAHSEDMRLITADSVTLATALFLAVSGAMYALGARTVLRRRRQRIVLIRAAAFALGWAAMALALLSPLASVSEWLFSAHMTQHTLLMLVASPLVVAGQPVATMMSGLPGRTAGSSIAVMRPIWRALTAPGTS